MAKKPKTQKELNLSDPDYAAYQATQEKLQTITNALNRGDAVFTSPDGSMEIVPKDAPAPDVLETAESPNHAGGPASGAAIDPGTLETLEKGLDMDRKAIALAESMAARQFECAKIIGQIQSLMAVETFSTTGRLILLRQMKESKSYKGLRVPQADGSIYVVNTFEDLCEAMGTSRRKVDEDLQNIAAFGEAFMNAAQQIGLGYRQLRALRALPEDDREEIKSLSNDPEALKDLLEEQFVEKSKLKEQLKEKDATLEAREKLLKEKNEKLDEAKTKILKLTSLSVDDAGELAIARQTEAMREIADAFGLLIGSGIKFFTTLNAALELEGLTPHTRGELESTANLAAQELADLFATQVEWKIDFEHLVYPDWFNKHLPDGSNGAGNPAAPSAADQAGS
ncbi:MAG: hypothetical protein LBQ51_05610 [Desulfovibrio sp.]|nr:hypothetical protein [Desulfovibrio sp.]